MVTQGAALPAARYVTFSGRVVECEVSDDASEQIFQEAISLSRFQAAFAVEQPLLVGLDFEWKPDRGSENNPIAVMQFACWDTVIIIRTTGCSELPHWLQTFLETGDSVIKVVASFDSADKAKLAASFGWDFDSKAIKASYWDIADLADAREIPRGLLKMAQHFEMPIQKLKSVGTSNWARGALSPEQRAYAADDAFFQLYLMGQLLSTGSSAPSASEQRLLNAWQVIGERLKDSIKVVDNSAYRENFLALREVVRNAIDVLSKALGSGGCTNLNELLKYKAIKKAVAAQRGSAVQVNAHFLRQNSDAFVVFFRSGQLCVRLRMPDGEEVEGAQGNGSLQELEQAPPNDEEVASLVTEVQELLCVYHAPNGKKQRVPEPQWIPARAVLTKAQRVRFEACLKHSESLESIETSHDSEDGLLLRLARHPRAPDDIQYMERSAQELGDVLEIGREEAKRRLSSDDKFLQFWSLLRTVEMNSPEEHSVVSSLRARERIHADAHRLALRMSGNVAWLQMQLINLLASQPLFCHLNSTSTMVCVECEFQCNEASAEVSWAEAKCKLEQASPLEPSATSNTLQVLAHFAQAVSGRSSGTAKC